MRVQKRLERVAQKGEGEAQQLRKKAREAAEVTNLGGKVMFLQGYLSKLLTYSDTPDPEQGQEQISRKRQWSPDLIGFKLHGAVRSGQDKWSRPAVTTPEDVQGIQR